jgi:hypothetical protein
MAQVENGLNFECADRHWMKHREFNVKAADFEKQVRMFIEMLR